MHCKIRLHISLAISVKYIPRLAREKTTQDRSWFILKRHETIMDHVLGFFGDSGRLLIIS